jgi:phage I-like protein
MTTTTQQKSIASTLIEVAAQGDLIPIFPAGIVIGYDGRGPYNLSNPDAVIAASKRNNVDLVIDRDHMADAAPVGRANPAAGWIKELVNQDGAIMARVEWTPTAQKQLADKEYRYISPTFVFDYESREVTRILRATLTNTPNFDMKAVASAQGIEDDEETIFQNPTLKSETLKMKELLLALAAMIGLDKTTSENEIVSAAIQKLKTVDSDMASIRLALKLDDKADGKTIVEVASTLVARPTDVADPSKFVPLTAFTELASQLKQVQDNLNTDKASAAVSEAMKAGKITPAQKDWATDYASQNPQEFAKYVASAPVIVSAASEIANKTAMAEGPLSAEDVELCSMIGLSQEDFKKQREAELKAA